MLSDVTNFATGAGAIFLIGFALLLVGGVVALVSRGARVRSGGIVALLGIVGIMGAVGVAAMTPAASVTSPVIPGTTVNTLLASTPALPAGETWNQATSTLTVLLAYNTTGNYYCVVSTASATHGCAAGGAGSAAHPLDVLLPLNLIRTDAQNTTALFDLSVASIPTATSLGASSALYSLIGYKSATSTTPGQWQVYNSAGTQANQYPTVSAPSVSTNVLTDGISVSAFSSKLDTVHLHLAGTNSTSAPESFASAIQNYTAYPVTFSVSQSSPATITVVLEVIDWTT